MTPAVARKRAGITLAVVEVEVLCRLLGVALPREITGGLGSHEVWTASLAGLAARGLVGCGTRGETEVHPAVAATLRLAAASRSRLEGVGDAGESVLVTSTDAAAPGVVLRHGAAGVVRLEPIRHRGDLVPSRPPPERHRGNDAQDCGSTRSQIESTPSASISGPVSESAAPIAAPRASSSAASSASRSASSTARPSTSTAPGRERGA